MKHGNPAKIKDQLGDLQANEIDADGLTLGVQLDTGRSVCGVLDDAHVAFVGTLGDTDCFSDQCYVATSTRLEMLLSLKRRSRRFSNCGPAVRAAVTSCGRTACTHTTMSATGAATLIRLGRMSWAGQDPRRHETRSGHGRHWRCFVVACQQELFGPWQQSNRRSPNRISSR